MGCPIYLDGTLDLAAGRRRYFVAISTNSTRRFFALPSSLLLLATGAYGPLPKAIRRAAAMPCFETSALITDCARAFDSNTLAAASPTMSVCPTMYTFSAELLVRSLAISSMAGSDSGFRSDYAVSK